MKMMCMSVVHTSQNFDIVFDTKNPEAGLFIRRGTNFYTTKSPYINVDSGKRIPSKYTDEVEEAVAVAQARFNEMKGMFTNHTDIGSKMESALLRVMNETSIKEVADAAKVQVDHYIQENYGAIPKKIAVSINGGKSGVINGPVHHAFEQILQYVSLNIPVFLTGPAGCGKNVICKQIAEAIRLNPDEDKGLDFYFTNCVIEPYMLKGFIDANGTYHETPFYKAFTKGGLFFLDEMDASSPAALLILNAAIANRYFDFPNGTKQAHKNFRVIAAGNTFGLGTTNEYTAREQLDAASLDRFALIPVDYDRDIENAVTNGNNELVEFAHEWRRVCNKAGIKSVFSYRGLLNISMMESNAPLDKVMSVCLVKGLNKDDLNQISSNFNIRNKYTECVRSLAA